MSEKSIPYKYLVYYKEKPYSLEGLILMNKPSLEWLEEISKMRNIEMKKIEKYEIASAFAYYNKLTPEMNKSLSEKLG